MSITTPPIIPSLPGDLTTTAPSQTEIDLSWIASTETNGTIEQYLVERCPGASCSNFSQIGTATDTTFNDISLPPVALTLTVCEHRTHQTIWSVFQRGFCNDTGSWNLYPKCFPRGPEYCARQSEKRDNHGLH